MSRKAGHGARMASGSAAAEPAAPRAAVRRTLWASIAMVCLAATAWGAPPPPEGVQTPPSQAGQAPQRLQAPEAADGDGAANAEQQPPALPQIVPAADLTLPDPIFNVDARITAARVQSWTERPGRVFMLLAEGDAELEIGLYGFQAERMVVRIETEPDRPRRVYHIAAYLEQARSRPRDAQAQTRIQAPALLVTGSIAGSIRLNADLLQPDEAEDHPAVLAARQRLARHREARARPLLEVDDRPVFDPQVEQRRQQRRAQIARRALEEPTITPLPPTPPPDEPVVEDEPAPEPPVVVDEPPAPDPEPEPTPEPDSPPLRILPDEGQVTLSARRVVVDGQRGAIALVGEVAVVYHGAPGVRPRALQADRAVVFFDPDKTAGGRLLDAGAVTGVYLEDNVVVTDGEYTVRGPRMYYDTATDQAVVLDAVLFTFHPELQVPLYMRARELRQHSLRSWEARDAILTTTAFAEPHIAVGARQLRVEERETEDRAIRRKIDARGVTLRAEGVPFFYLPFAGGELGESPLDSISVGYRSHVGPMIRTRWDAFSLAGQTAPEGVRGLLKLDYLGRHGPGVGARLDYDRPQMRGRFDSILLPYDTGRDVIGDRETVRFDGDQRGFVRLVHRHELPEENLTADLEVSYVSDPTFLEEFYRTRADIDQPWQTRIFLKHGEEDWAATLGAQYDLNNFVPQTTTLQAPTTMGIPGHSVEKTVELGYRLIGASLWDDRLTYYGETRAGWMRFRGGRDRPADRGITGADSLALFGIGDDERFATALEAEGLDDSRRLRLDTRHELSAPMVAGDVNITPYLVGRFTAYDTGFEDFRGEDEWYRLYGQAGVRASVRFHRAYPDVSIPVLDVSGLRHIIEPHADVFFAGSNIDSRKLPVFDMDVEGISRGLTSRIGLRQTWQTMRGGPGQWRSVDWLVVDADLILRTSEAETEHRLGRYFASRPEMTLGGDHAHGRIAWQVTDTSALSGEVLYGLDRGRFDYWRAGWALRTSAPLEAYVDYAEIADINSKRLSYGLGYRISDKYAFGANLQHDFGQRRARLMALRLSRRLPQAWLNFVGGFDDIEDEVFFGISFTPDLGGADPEAHRPFR